MGPVRCADWTCPVIGEIRRFSAGADMGERVPPFRLVFKHITDITAIEGHADLPALSCPFLDIIRIFKKNPLSLLPAESIKGYHNAAIIHDMH
jgi:hypothetical protein